MLPSPRGGALFNGVRSKPGAKSRAGESLMHPRGRQEGSASSHHVATAVPMEESPGPAAQ